MTSNGHDEPLPKWTDFENRNIVRIAGMVFVAWIFFGMLVPLVWTSLPDFVIPSKQYEVMGQFGDMFGAINSLFSGLAFFAAIVAILGQTAEMKEAGKRQLEQDRLQTRQEELQTQQMQLAAKTAEIQETNMKELIRHRKEAVLVEVLERVHTLNIKLKFFRERADQVKREPQEHVIELRHSALAEVLIEHAKLSSVRGSVIITFLADGVELQAAMTGWLNLVDAVQPKDHQGPVISSEELAKKSKQLLQAAVDSVGVLHNKIVQNSSTQGPT